METTTGCRIRTEDVRSHRSKSQVHGEHPARCPEKGQDKIRKRCSGEAIVLVRKREEKHGARQKGEEGDKPALVSAPPYACLADT